MFIRRISKQNTKLYSLSLQHLKKWPNITSGIHHRFKTTYVVLLPEVPEDTPAGNPLLKDSELPNFDEITAEKCYFGVGKRCLDYETGIWAIEEKIRSESSPKSFDSIINDVDLLDAPLTYAWSTVKTFYSVKNDELSTSNYLKIHERARKARIYKFQSQPIFEACKEIYVSTDLNEVQKRVIRKFLLEARLNGLELPAEEKEHLNMTLKKLEEYKMIYRRKLQEASTRFSYQIIDHNIVRDFPESLLKKMSFNNPDHLKGPWVVTHHPSVYHQFLEHCPDKDLRWNAWNGYIMRNSGHLVQELDNGIHVEEIRGARKLQAKILGFKSFADMSMETKMAGTVDNVLAVIASIFSKAKEKQMEELKALQEFAHNRGFDGELAEWDIPYWRRKNLIHITKSEERPLREYFPFDHVWDQLLALSSNLFGIHFEEVPQNEVQTWDPQVRFYNILDSDGKKIASFYVDPFQRPNQKLNNRNNSAWMLSLKTRCDAVNYIPVSSLIFNFPNPLPENENISLLAFEDLQTLFKKFGHALQHLLSTVPYAQVSGLTNIEWDAVEVCSNFMLNWLYEPTVLEKLSKHYKTGDSLDKPLITSILIRRSHMAGFDMCNELFLAHYDIRLHSEDTFWADVLRDLWPVYMPFELDKNYSLPCWFSPIMSDIWAAAYYSHVWSKMLAMDAFKAFKECEPQDVTAVGRRFKETFFSLGGGAHPTEVFRKFRGRDPSPDALHEVLDSS